MVPGLHTFVQRAGLARVARMSGVSKFTIQNILQRLTPPGPRTTVKLLNAIGRFKIQSGLGAGLSREAAADLRNKSFAEADRVADRTQRLINQLSRDRFIPDEGFTRAEIRGFIEEGVRNSSKSLRQLFEPYEV